MKTVLIICYSPLHRDPRVLRQIDAMLGSVEVITAGLSGSGRKVKKHISLNDEKRRSAIQRGFRLILNIVGKIDQLYWTDSKVKDLKNLRDNNYDWIIANDLQALPISLQLASLNKSNIIFDAHEYYPAYLQSMSLQNWFLRRKITLLCKNYIHQAHFMTVVSPEIQKLYKNNFKKDSILVTNATAYKKLEPSKVDEDKIHLVHHGIAAPGRKIELMIEMMQNLKEEYILHLYLVQTSDFREYYLELKKATERNKSRIIFHDIVETDKIPEEINQYDVGVFLLPPTNINYKYALPNKFFEFIQARLAIAIGPSVDMKKYVDRYKLGVVSDKFTIDSFCTSLNALTIGDIINYKKNAHNIAYDMSAEVSMRYYKNIILSNKDL